MALFLSIENIIFFVATHKEKPFWKNVLNPGLAATLLPSIELFIGYARRDGLEFETV